MTELTGPTGPITSRSNPRIAAVAALRARRARDERHETIVDGAREVARAAAAGVDIVAAYVCPELVRTDDERAAVASLAAREVVSIEVSRAAFERIAFGDRTDGVVAVVRTPATTLDALARRLPPEPLVVVLEGVEKPGNLGAVLRSADGAGADALIAADPRTDLWNPNAIRASLGTIFALPLAAAPSREVVDWLRGRRIRIVAARPDGGTTWADADLTGSVALVLGSEAAGLSDAWRTGDVLAVRLPMLGVADSLNVSTTAAILLYESRRQRDASGGR